MENRMLVYEKEFLKYKIDLKNKDDLIQITACYDEIFKLTPVEQKIFEGMILGLTPAEIASRLKLSKKHILRQLQVMPWRCRSILEFERTSKTKKGK